MVFTGLDSKEGRKGRRERQKGRMKGMKEEGDDVWADVGRCRCRANGGR